MSSAPGSFQELEAHFEVLTDKQRLVWTHVVERGCTRAEAARQLGISPRNCREHLSRAVDKLRKAVLGMRQESAVVQLCDRAWVLRHIRRYATSAEIRWVLDLYLGGARYEQIAEFTGRSREAVRKVVSRRRDRTSPAPAPRENA
ncbi:MAG: sigma factor-like helix-turn-helix DNA-binding protein [Planctomycetota bacterium]